MATQGFNNHFGMCLAHAKVIIETWRKHYNAVRTHSSLEYQTPLEFVSQWKSESTTGAGVSR